MNTDTEFHQDSQALVAPEPSAVTANTGRAMDVKAFSENVKRMCELQDAMKDLGRQRKELNAEMVELREEVIGYMVSENVRACNYFEDEIFVNRRTATGPLTKATLRAGLDFYFSGQSDGADQAEACFEHIVGSLGEREVTELKRRKRKAPKPAQEGGAKRGRGRKTAAASEAVEEIDE